MHKEFRAVLQDELDIMEDAGTSITDSTIQYYETIYAKGGYPCPVCFVRKNKNISMTCMRHDVDQDVENDIFRCSDPECDELIEVEG